MLPSAGNRLVAVVRKSFGYYECMALLKSDYCIQESSHCRPAVLQLPHAITITCFKSSSRIMDYSGVHVNCGTIEVRQHATNFLSDRVGNFAFLLHQTFAQKHQGVHSLQRKITISIPALAGIISLLLLSTWLELLSGTPYLVFILYARRALNMSMC